MQRNRRKRQPYFPDGLLKKIGDVRFGNEIAKPFCGEAHLIGCGPGGELRRD
jgi:hypothetical protein